VFYDYALTIPANTTAASPSELEISLTHGVIHRVEIEFPAGCAGLAHLAVFLREFQLFPTNPGREFASDDHVIAFDDYFEMFEPPHNLLLRGYNTDDTYSHTITVRIGVLPKDVAEHLYGRRSRVDRTRLYDAFGIPPPGG
jgi:hypothetical protein